MKKQVFYIVVGIVGLAAGIGAGFMINKPKLDQSQAQVAELQTKMQETEKASQQQLQMAAADTARAKTELNRVNTELTRYKAEYVRANTELARATNELNNLKASIIPQSEVPDIAATADTAAAPAGNTSSGTAAVPAVNKTPVVAAGEYVIRDGDNLWKIAAEQLGKGIRYKEILALNPGLSEKKELVVGSKIKLPAK